MSNKITAAVLLLCCGLAATAAFATDYSVGPQYDSTHVYVSPQDFDRFVAGFTATFGGTASKQAVLQVTPTPGKTMWQFATAPCGPVSVFGFKTPIPYPFGAERTGYLVSDFDGALAAAKADGADVIVSPFADPVGRDAVISWPGGVNMQIYWHSTPPHYPALTTIPENRLYLSPLRAEIFVHDFLAFSGGRVVSDDPKAPGIEIGRPGETIRRIRIQSGFGKLAIFVNDGHLSFPYGRELMGYEVADLASTLARAEAAGVTILVPPYDSDRRTAAMVQFPGGYIAEIHSPAVNVSAPAPK